MHCSAFNTIHFSFKLKAVLLNCSLVSSPVAVPSAGRCLSFYYYMYGENVGTLSVYVGKTDSGEGPPVWSISGSRTDR